MRGDEGPWKPVQALNRIYVLGQKKKKKMKCDFFKKRQECAWILEAKTSVGNSNHENEYKVPGMTAGGEKEIKADLILVASRIISVSTLVYLPLVIEQCLIGQCLLRSPNNLCLYEKKIEDDRHCVRKMIRVH